MRDHFFLLFDTKISKTFLFEAERDVLIWNMAGKILFYYEIGHVTNWGKNGKGVMMPCNFIISYIWLLGGFD